MIINTPNGSDSRLEQLSGINRAAGKSKVVGESGGQDNDKRCQEVCKGFESVLIEKMLDEMKNTIGQWDEDKDPAENQIFGIFSYHMADHISKEGGFGLWKDVYESLNGNQADAGVLELDSEI